jgi:hypothetical protein
MSPTWSTTPHDIRIREDIPNATNTDAGKTIIKNKRFLGGLSGTAQGLAIGTGAGALTGLGLSEFTDLSDPISIAIGAGVATGSAVFGGLGGALLGHKKAKIDLAEAELGIKKPTQNIQNSSNESVLDTLKDALIISQI